MTTLSPDTVRRIEDAAAALIAAGTPNPTNEQVRQHLGGGSLSHISPVMRAEALPLREQVARLTATGEHLAAQLQDTKAELKEAREDGRQLQTELLALARQDGKVKK